MAQEALKPGEAGKQRYSLRGGRVRAKQRVRLWNGEYKEVSGTGDNETRARIACDKAVQKRLGRPPGSATMQPETLLGAAAQVWFDGAWLESKYPNAERKTQSLQRYEPVYKSWIHPHLGRLRLREVSLSVVRHWLATVSETEKWPTIDMACVVLNHVLDLAVEHEAMRSNPLRLVKRPEAKSAEPKALTASVIGTLRAALRQYEIDRLTAISPVTGKRLGGPRPTGDVPCVIDLMLATGARIGEVLALRWQDVFVDIDGKPGMVIDATLVYIKGKGTVYQEHPKTEAGSRRVTLPPFAIETLLAYKPANAEPSDWVFPARASVNPRSLSNVHRSLRTYLAGSPLTVDLELPEDEVEWHKRRLTFRPHDLRKTVATFVARERKTEDAAALLGHSMGGGVTTKHYIERLRTAPDVTDILQALVEASEREVPLPAPVKATRPVAKRKHLRAVA